MAYTKQSLKQDLAAMGLTGAETILIHSSMKSIGEVEGGRRYRPGCPDGVFCTGVASAADPYLALYGWRKYRV